MSQRLIRPGLAAVMFRGQELTPITLPSGRQVWPIAGGAEDDDSGGGDNDDTGDEEDHSDDDDSDDEEDDPEDKSDDDKKSKKNNKDDDDEDATVPQWKYDKIEARMRAADKRSSDLQKQLEELKGKKDINAETKAEIDELKPRAERLEKENTDLKIRLAFFSLNTFEWQDTDAALRLIDLSDVELNDKGEVDKRALKSAIKDLAKNKKYLLKPAKDEDEEDTTGNGQPSGTKMAGKRKGQRGEVDKEALAKRFPVLQNR